MLLKTAISNLQNDVLSRWPLDYRTPPFLVIKGVQ
jgi:hypothetical protein